jgi:hypothetical protein
MTDLAVEAALVAEALGGRVHEIIHANVVVHFGEGSDKKGNIFWTLDESWQALVLLARRFRETEQERDRWRDLALQHAPAAPHETGAWRCMVAMPAHDHCTGGYRMATEPPSCPDGTASVPVRDWWDDEREAGDHLKPAPVEECDG